MMIKMQNLLIFLFLTFSFEVIVLNAKVFDTSHMLLARQKRTLIFQPGLNWIQMIAGIGLPVELKDQSITIGAAVKSYYRVPNNSSDFTRPTITVARKERNVITRWQIYEIFVRLLERYGYSDSKACLLQSICEVSSMSFDEKSGLLAEILQILLRPSSTGDLMENYVDVEYKAAEKLGKQYDSCHLIFPDCKSNFLNKFIH